MFKSLKTKVFEAVLEFCKELKFELTPEKYDDCNIINFYHCSIEVEKDEIAIVFDLAVPAPFAAKFGAFMVKKFGKSIKFYQNLIIF
jgi:hypothetical protein